MYREITHNEENQSKYFSGTEGGCNWDVYFLVLDNDGSLAGIVLCEQGETAEDFMRRITHDFAGLKKDGTRCKGIAVIDEGTSKEIATCTFDYTKDDEGEPYVKLDIRVMKNREYMLKYLDAYLRPFETIKCIVTIGYGNQLGELEWLPNHNACWICETIAEWIQSNGLRNQVGINAVNIFTKDNEHLVAFNIPEDWKP